MYFKATAERMAPGRARATRIAAPGPLADRAKPHGTARRGPRMEPIPASTELSLRKSRGRRVVMMSLNAVGETYLGHLARMTGIERNRVRYILHGRLPYYRLDLSLVAQGLVEPVLTATGRIYRITTKGRRKARSLAKRVARGERI